MPKEGGHQKDVRAKGRLMAFVNDHVDKGQLLVSGLIGNEDRKVASKAEIYGETWYKSEVTVPLETSFTLYTGKVRTKHKLSFGSWGVPFGALNLMRSR